jgi:hypothetical protein
MGFLSVFKAIYEKLKPGNVRCAANDQELATCAQNIGGDIAAFHEGWGIRPLLQLLGHEPTLQGGDPDSRGRARRRDRERQNALPNRHGAEYPFGATPPSKDQTAAIRSDNPDGYAYFAAHVWQDIWNVSSSMRSLTSDRPRTLSRSHARRRTRDGSEPD